MVSLFADGMLLYTENPKDAIKKLLELINEFSKAAGYKLNTQKAAAFLYNNKNQKKNLRKKIPFIMASKRIEYLGIDIPKGGKKSIL